MKLLDALVRTGPTRSPARSSFSEWLTYFTFNNHTYGLPGFTTTMGAEPAETIDANFAGYVEGALKSNGIIFGCEQIRLAAFSEARFQFRPLRDGRPGDLFGTQALAILEQPWEGGTTGDLLARMLVDADFAGNSYSAIIDGEIVRLRPDWVEIMLAPRNVPMARDGERTTVGYRRVGYAYYEGGRGAGSSRPAIFLPDEVAHFAPMPDPLATYRGMSWLTPVVREVQADQMFTRHKIRFMENSATPNIAVSLPKEVSADAFAAFVAKMDEAHKGADNAGKTLYTGGGADVTVIGANFDSLDLKAVQGAGETRIATAAGVHPVLAGLSEGLEGSSLNAGNFAAARRRFADLTMRPLWRNVSGSLQTLVPPPVVREGNRVVAGAELWFDERDIAFLREDEGDAAKIQQVRAQTITALIREGFTPESAIKAVDNDDFRLLVHTGLVSVQLQPPGAAPAAALATSNGNS
jgi:phage portal protein BeeE